MAALTALAGAVNTLTVGDPEKDLNLVPRRNLRYAHAPLSRDEEDTVATILASDRNCDIVLAPTHHMDADGVLHGFRVAYPQHTAEISLPVNREMFFGHTLVEAGAASASMNADVMRLTANPGRCRELMAEFLAEVDAAATGAEAGLHCVPRNVDHWEQGHAPQVSAGMYNAEGRSTDSAPWRPEVPVRIGIYHAFARGFSRDVREHKIFLSVTGGCTLAAENYYNLLLDLGMQTDVDEIADSEETFWLQQASYRARCRLLHLLAVKFGLRTKTIADINAYDEQQMVLATTDTVYNNITRLRSGHIAVFNECVDTTTSKNGVINAMHPSEGLWVYKGVPRSSGGASHMGFGFGDQRVCGIFPSGSFVVTGRHGARGAARSTVCSQNSEVVVTYKCDAAGGRREFSWPDESFMQTLGDMGWDRNNGIVELIPIVVGVTRW